jgi:hypothetical protein
MNREPEPCGKCARFLPAAQLRKGEDGPGHCEGFERPAHSTDQPCVLFNERGTWEARKAQMPGEAGRRRKTTETA